MEGLIDSWSTTDNWKEFDQANSKAWIAQAQFRLKSNFQSKIIPWGLNIYLKQTAQSLFLAEYKVEEQSKRLGVATARVVFLFGARTRGGPLSVLPVDLNHININIPSTVRRQLGFFQPCIQLSLPDGPSAQERLMGLNQFKSFWWAKSSIVVGKRSNSRHGWLDGLPWILTSASPTLNSKSKDPIAPVPWTFQAGNH